MQIKHGSNRTALFIGNFVFKFPRGYSLKSWLRILWRFITGKPVAGDIRLGILHYTRGIHANLTEFMLWNATRSSFLVPVLTLGLITIQRYESGQEPTASELQELFSRFPEDMNFLFTVDPHCLHMSNWRRNEKGFRLIDYGDTFGNGYPLSLFISQHHTKLAEILSKPPA